MAGSSLFLIMFIYLCFHQAFGDFCGPLVREPKTHHICGDSSTELSLECPHGEIINVKSVLYGRQREALMCILDDIVECNSTEALDLVSQHCDNQNSCTVLLNEDLESNPPCTGGLEAKYLRVNYTCYGEFECQTYHTMGIGYDVTVEYIFSLANGTTRFNMDIKGSHVFIALSPVKNPDVDLHDPSGVLTTALYDTITTSSSYCQFRRSTSEHHNFDSQAILSSTEFTRFYFLYVDNYLEIGIEGEGPITKANITCPGDFRYIGVGSRYPNAADFRYCVGHDDKDGGTSGITYETNTPNCPDGGWYFKERCYWLIKEPTRVWTEANTYCSRQGKDLQLVMPKDDETNEFLERMLCETGTDSIWIGMGNLQDANYLRWLDGSFVNRTNSRWAPSEPVRKGWRCGFAVSYPEMQWYTDICSISRKPFVCSQTYEEPVCPNGGTFFRDRCYWLGKGTHTWHEADRACQEEYGPKVRLPVVRDRITQGFLERFFNIYNGQSVWLGAYKTASEDWVWVDRTAITYAGWDFNEPKDGNCAIISSVGNWKAEPCYQYFPYICALPPCEGSLPEELTSDYGSGYGEPGIAVDSVCSTACNCVSTAACFHDGSCRCLPLFDDMVCDKANFKMSVSASSQVIIDNNVTITCQVNIPLSDVTLMWTKVGKKKTKRLRGHAHAHKGTSELTIKNFQQDDFGVYICTATFDIERQQLTEIESVALRDERFESGENSSSQYIQQPSFEGLVAGVVFLTLVGVVLIGIMVVLLNRRKRYGMLRSARLTDGNSDTSLNT